MDKIRELELQAVQTRRDILNQGPRCGCRVHVAPALSCADILTALYFDVLKIDAADPQRRDRDRFVISKGHACPPCIRCCAEEVISRRNTCGAPNSSTASCRATRTCARRPAST